jgi:RNA polymerase sigma factor (sigma-70 family)
MTPAPTLPRTRTEEDAKDWFKRAYERLSARLFLLARGILSDPESARDAMQEAALRVYNRLPVLDDLGTLEGYLLVTTRNVAVDMLRKKGRTQTREDLQPPAPTDSWRPGQDELQLLAKALGALPLNFQEVLYLRYREGLNAKQAAERIGISHANARARLSRAHRALKQELGVSS